MAKHHLVIGRDTVDPWCVWTGSQAGQSIAEKAGRPTCDHSSRAAADRAAAKLRPHFRRGAVRVVAGPCPHAPEA